MAEPSNSNAFAHTRDQAIVANGIDDADDLVPRNDGPLRIFKVAIDHVQVRSADGASLDPDAQLTRTRQRIGPFLQH
jgi:hypothetical protein